MGLDNGIIVRHLKQSDIPDVVKVWWEYDNGQTEIAYWRKQWGLRNEIMAFLDMDNDAYRSPNLTKVDIQGIIKIIQRFLDKEYYEENANSPWSYEDAIDNLTSTQINLIWLYGYMITHPNLEVYFYDSY